MRRTPDRARSAGPGRASQLGRAGYGKTGTQWHVTGAGAYALDSLAVATGREDFAAAASECIAFEGSSFDAGCNNWPDLRGEGEPSWPCQWCHGAPGIGLARVAMARHRKNGRGQLKDDVVHAVEVRRRGGRAMSILFAAVPLAISNSFVRPRAPLGARILVNLLRVVFCRSLKTPPRLATTAGTAVRGNSTWAYFAALPVSATQRCARSMARFPMC